MSNITLAPNAAGTATFTVASPATNTNQVLTLPDATTTLVGTDATQTLTNKTLQGGSITSGTAIPSTSGTNIDFTGIPTWVKRITVMFSGVSTNGTSLKIVQLGTSGGVIITNYASEGFSQGGSSGVSTSGFVIGSSSAVGNSVYGSMIISSFGGGIWSEQFGISSGTNAMAGGGGLTGAGTIDRVRVTTLTGTDLFDAGTINITWEG